MATMLDLRLELIVPELAATTKAEVLAEFASLVTAGFPELECEVVVRTLQEREKLGTGVYLDAGRPDEARPIYRDFLGRVPFHIFPALEN